MAAGTDLILTMVMLTTIIMPLLLIIIYSMIMKVNLIASTDLKNIGLEIRSMVIKDVNKIA